MGTYTSYGILVLCICFIQTFGIEYCNTTHYCNTGFCCDKSDTWYCRDVGQSSSDCLNYNEMCSNTHVCFTGFCCKVDGVWMCTPQDLSNSECNSLSKTTTTEAPSTGNVVIYATVGGFMFVGFVVVVVVFGIRHYKMKHSSPAVRSPTVFK